MVIIGHTMSADHPQVGHRYLPKNTHRSCTCESGSHYSHETWQIQMTIVDFCRYLLIIVQCASLNWFKTGLLTNYVKKFKLLNW